MKSYIVLFALIVAASAQRAYQDYPDTPIPYSFNYVAPGEEGQSSHQETSDGNGNVQGSYSLQVIDGRMRMVDYVADGNGFRANVRTNEPGTGNQNPADVTIDSSAEQYQGAVAQQPRPQQLRRVVQPVARPVVRQMHQPGFAFGNENPGYILVPADQSRHLNYY